MRWVALRQAVGYGQYLSAKEEVEGWCPTLVRESSRSLGPVAALQVAENDDESFWRQEAKVSVDLANLGRSEQRRYVDCGEELVEERAPFRPRSTDQQFSVEVGEVGDDENIGEWRSGGANGTKAGAIDDHRVKNRAGTDRARCIGEPPEHLGNLWRKRGPNPRRTTLSGEDANRDLAPTAPKTVDEDPLARWAELDTVGARICSNPIERGRTVAWSGEAREGTLRRDATERRKRKRSRAGAVAHSPNDRRRNALRKGGCALPHGSSCRGSSHARAA